MRILVFGAGNIGLLYASLLEQSGQDVTILARGKRLEEIRGHGIRLRDSATRRLTTVRVTAVEGLEPDACYDLVLVAIPKHRVAEALSVLARNRSPSMMFFCNNASGPSAMVDALGRHRVLQGFPGAAAIPVDGALSYLILSGAEQPTTIGELDGTPSPRIRRISESLRVAGFSTAICKNMTAWLQTHAAEIAPTALALYRAGNDRQRLAGDPATLKLMLHAIREGYRVLDANGVPITPWNHRLFTWLPETWVTAIMRRQLRADAAAIKIGHASAAREEMRLMAEELRAMAQAAGVATPALDQLASSESAGV